MSIQGIVTHNGWNDLLWLRHQLGEIRVTNALSVLDVLLRFAKRNQLWHEGDIETFMEPIGQKLGLSSANLVFFGLFWSGVISPNTPNQSTWYDNSGINWGQFRGHVRFSDRGLVLLNEMRN
jgi:hypothetical protein